MVLLSNTYVARSIMPHNPPRAVRELAWLRTRAPFSSTRPLAGRAQSQARPRVESSARTPPTPPWTPADQTLNPSKQFETDNARLRSERHQSLEAPEIMKLGLDSPQDNEGVLLWAGLRWTIEWHPHISTTIFWITLVVRW